MNVPLGALSSSSARKKTDTLGGAELQLGLK